MVKPVLKPLLLERILRFVEHNPDHHLIKLARRLGIAVQSLTSHLIAQDFSMASIDVSALTADVTELQTLAQQIASGDSAAVQAAVAAQLESDQAAFNQAEAALKAEIASLQAQLNPKPTSLTVSPASLTIAVGSSGNTAVSVTGGTGAITASGLPSGITWDGSANLVSDGTQAAGSSTVDFSDSSSPALTGSLSLTVA